MNLELTVKERQLILDALHTRVRTVESLLHGWRNDTDESGIILTKLYNEDLNGLNELLKTLENLT